MPTLNQPSIHFIFALILSFLNHADTEREISSSPEVIINSLEPTLLLGQGTPAKDRLEVDPLTLDQVKVVEVLIQISQTALPDGGLVFEHLVIRRVLQ